MKIVVEQYLKVSCDKNRIDPICETCVVHNLSDCVNRPLGSSNTTQHKFVKIVVEQYLKVSCDKNRIDPI
jgi:hypothetical protein